ncbi:MAG: universal stress protein [Bacteroidota bacterium]|nr:universal stress protein [Bacteroidota bacterium]
MAKIIVPVDFSDCSENNCKFSLELATRLGAEIVLLHCFNENSNFPVLAYMDNASVAYQINSPLQTADEEETKNALDSFLANLKKMQDKLGFHDVVVRQEIVYGTPAEEIICFCNDENPDLLLLSTQSTGDKVKKILGSLSYHLLTSVNVPVLVIPRDVELTFSKSIKIAFVSRFEENELKSLNRLIRLVSVFNASLTILHVGSLHDEEKYIAQLSLIQKQLSSFYKKHNVNFELINNVDWIEGIKNYSTQNNIDIISFTSKRRSFFSQFFNPGITKNLLFEYDKPLLVFHT